MSTVPTAAFETAYPFIAKWEGGFVDDPRDPGGATNMGITIDTLSDWLGRPASVDDVRNLTSTEAQQIYFTRYWTPIHCDQIPVSLALMTFNAAVNCGPSRGAKLLQQALNDLDQNLVVDGVVGPTTLAAANHVDQRSAVQKYEQVHEAYYRGLANFSIYGRGWLNRLSDVTAGALNLVGKTPAPAVGETAMQPDETVRPAGPGADISDIEHVVTRVLELARVLQQVRTKQPPQNQKSDDLDVILRVLLAIAGGSDGSAQTPSQAASSPATSDEAAENNKQTLTPVNNALGPALGKLLDGRKTALGSIGLLATTILPVFFPQLAPIASIISAVGSAIDPGAFTGATTDPAAAAGSAATASQIIGSKIMAVVQPLFALLTGWGVLGKLEKWSVHQKR
ncbi:MAG: glycosyl hydrolase 108 family protein [Pseudomonadota bacterium]